MEIADGRCPPLGDGGRDARLIGLYAKKNPISL